MKKLLLLLLLLSSFSANSQTTKAVALSVTQAAKTEFCLRVFPSSGRKTGSGGRPIASGWHHGSIWTPVSRTGKAWMIKMLSSETAAKTEWTSKVRKRGVTNGLLLALSGVMGYLALGP